MGKDKGERVTIKGVLYRDGSIGDIYEAESETKSSGGKSKIIEAEAGNQATTAVATETVSQAGQSVVQAVVAQAQSMGASGLVAMGSAGAFQANHVFDNTYDVFEVATPLVEEFVDTGTITPPETSKYAGEVIPTTQSFVGVKVGEARKQAIAEKAAEKAIQQDVKQATQAMKEVAKASEETKAKQVEAEQKEAQAEARAEAVEQLGEEKVKEIEEKLNEPIPTPEPPTPDQQNAIRETFRNLFNRDPDDTDATPI